MTRLFYSPTHFIVCRGFFILENHQQHLYADDLQGLVQSELANVWLLQMAIQGCLMDVSAWCTFKRLQLNASKTEVMWFRDSDKRVLVTYGRQVCLLRTNCHGASERLV